jgi:hypothetical protein
MNEKSEWQLAAEREAAEDRAARAEYSRKRAIYREKLFGSSDPVDCHAPQAIEDFDALLAQHAAQLRHAIAYTMEAALDDDVLVRERPKVIASLARLVQTNVAIAKVLRDKKTKNGKTVHGGGKMRGTQD